MTTLREWLKEKIKYIQSWGTNKLTISNSLFERNSTFLGSDYGGWAILPDTLSHQAVVYSFGIGEDASFDLEIIEKYGVEVHAFDPTPNSIKWVENQIWPEQFHFHPFGIGASDRMAAFYAPENPNHISYTILPRNPVTEPVLQVQLLRLKSIADQLGHQEIAILKMDIEGAEYEVIEDLLKTPEIRIQQLLVEFHHFLPYVSYKETKAVIDELSRHGYKIFNISKRGYEYSFIRQ